MKKTYIIYHAQCHDGATSAWVAWKLFGENATYISATYGDAFPTNLMPLDSEVYILDFSYKKEVLLAQPKQMKIVVLDHHKTAQAELEGLNGVDGIRVVFDMKKSGAGIACDYFFPNNRPTFINLVEDRYLFRFKDSRSKPLYYVMQWYNYDFRKYDDFHNSKIDKIISTGIKYQEYNENLVKLFSMYIKQHIVLDRINIPVFELPKEFGSDVCKYFLDHNKEYDVCAYFTQKKDLHWEWGIRGNGNIDVSMIAKLYGGGGHKDAAGFPVYGSSPYEFRLK